MEDFLQDPRQAKRGLYVLGLIYFVLYLLWLLFGQNNLNERFTIGRLALIFSGLAVILMSARTWQKTEGRARTAWGWFVAGQSIWLGGDFWQLFVQGADNNNYAFELVYFLFYFLGSIALWYGLVVYPKQARQTQSRLRLFFDATIATTAALTLIWRLVIQPVVLNGMGIYSVYPTVDLVTLILVMNLYMFLEAENFPRIFGWLCLSLVVYTFSDLSYASLLAHGKYQPGMAVDIGWVVGDIVVLVAAVLQLQHQPSVNINKWLGKFLQNLQSILPVASVVLVGWFALIQWQVYQVLDTLSLWVTVMLSMGLIARQGVLAGEIEQQQYTSLVNSIAEPAFVCDQNGQIKLANPALLELAGYEAAQDLLNQPFSCLLSPDFDLDQVFDGALKEGWTGELDLQTRSVQYIPILLTLRPIKAGRSRKLALAGTAHDLRQQKSQQAELQEAYEQIAADRSELEILNEQLEQKVIEKTASLSEAYLQLEQQNRSLQKLDELKTDFVSLVSHELRAPLTNISGGIELLMVKKEALPDRTVFTLELVQAEIQRLGRFVETILDLSALDAGRNPIYLSPVPLRSVVATLKKQMTHLYGAERVVWQIPEKGPYLLADDQALTSVLFHLVDNALKYAPQGAITISAGMDDGQYYIKVEDEGEGIPEESLPYLFDRFYRSHNNDSQEVYGHGLGLYIVRRLTEAMNGQVSASNREQGGAVFTVWFQVVREEE